MKLSILIPTLPRRCDYLRRLRDILDRQLTPEVEVITDAGDGSVGMKRNRLLARASGLYAVFADDDDTVTADYVAQLFVGIHKSVDAICIRGIVTTNGREPRQFIDLPYQKHSTRSDGTYLRGAQHLDAIKRDIAIAVSYEDKSFGEDLAYTKALEATGLIKTWHSVQHPIYFYDYRSPKPV